MRADAEAPSAGLQRIQAAMARLRAAAAAKPALRRQLDLIAPQVTLQIDLRAATARSRSRAQRALSEAREAERAAVAACRWPQARLTRLRADLAVADAAFNDGSVKLEAIDHELEQIAIEIEDELDRITGRTGYAE